MNAAAAWREAALAGHPGAEGIRIAILDTGIGNGHGVTRSAPDLSMERFAAGLDVVDGDRQPDDDGGHGTLMAALVGEDTNNGFGLAGLAFRATIIPVRVIDSRGNVTQHRAAVGLRFAIRAHADVVLMSFSFAWHRADAGDHELRAALRLAGKAAVLVAAAGNTSSRISLPAAAPSVIGVGATTDRRCLAAYSNFGRGIDLVAPGGGPSGALPALGHQCAHAQDGRPVHALFANEGGAIEGTSVAAAEVAGLAALTMASTWRNRSPAQTVQLLLDRAQDIGPHGIDRWTGRGLANGG